MEEREGGGYRDAGGLLRCPACGVPMEARPFGDKVIDQCGTCAGLWIDWFDGPLHSACSAMVKDLGWRGQISELAPNRVCPRCRVPLGSEEWELHPLLRCPECSGAWVTREAAIVIAEHFRSEADPFKQARESLKASAPLLDVDTYERTLRGAAAPEFDPDKDETDRYEERLRSESGLGGLFRDLDEDRKRR